MRVKLQDVPQELWRRVANKIESIRGTPMAPGANKMRLGETACPVYRPDVKGIAYWEFEIVNVKQTAAREHDGKSSGVGFMLASTGKHDIPIPHWSVTVEPPSQALMAKNRESEISKIFKLDTLSYSSEDKKGVHLAQLGQFPLQVKGMRGDISKYQGVESAMTVVKTPSKDDRSPPRSTFKTDQPIAAELKLASWDSWPALKKGFAKTYQPHLFALAKRAASSWEVESLIVKFGEGIPEGQSLTVPLLKPGKAKIQGDGAKFAKLTVLAEPVNAVRLTALPAEEKKELNFQLNIAYQDGGSEILHFFILPKGTPSNRRSVLPHSINK